MSNILLPVHDTENVSHGYKFEASVWIQFKEIRHEKVSCHLTMSYFNKYPGYLLLRFQSVLFFGKKILMVDASTFSLQLRFSLSKEGLY